jgi:hypothetical protein
MNNVQPQVVSQQPPIQSSATNLPPNSEIIQGGNADGLPDTQFDSEQLGVGISVEMEHTKDINVAKEIAKDHLKADKDYYRKLAKMDADARLAESSLTPDLNQPAIPAEAVVVTPIPDPTPISTYGGNAVFLMILGC